MPLFPGDFKKFKYLEHDDNTVTLEHPSKHQIRIARKAIKDPKMVEMLDAMCHGGPVKPIKKNEGGLIPAIKRSGALGTQRKVEQDVADQEHRFKESMQQDPGAVFSKKETADRAPASSSDPRTPEAKQKAKAFEDTGELPEWTPDRKARLGYQHGGAVKPPVSNEEFVRKEGVVADRAPASEDSKPKSLWQSFEGAVHNLGADIDKTLKTGKVKQRYNDGGIVDKIVPDYSDPTSGAFYVEGAKDQSIEAQKKVLDPLMQKTIQNYNLLAFDKMPGEPRVQIADTFGPNGEPPAQIHPELAAKAKAMAEAEMQREAAEKEAAAKKAQEDNEIRYKQWQEQNAVNAQFGQPAIPLPEGIQQPQAPVPDVTETQGLAAQEVSREVASASQEPIEPAKPKEISPLNQQIAGIKAEALAKQAQADAQVEAYKKQAEAMDLSKAEFDNKYASLEAERQNLINDINNGAVDPEKFWDNHSRVASAIGILFGAMNTNGTNQVVKYLDTLMEQNLQTQKENLGYKKSLLEANLKQFGNLKDAQTMTRAMQADMLANAIGQAAAKAANPLAKAAAQQAIGELRAKAQVTTNELAKKQAIASLMQNARGSSDAAEAAASGLEMMGNYEEAGKIRNRIVPGFGLANTTEDAKVLKDLNADLMAAKSGINKLETLMNRPLKSLSVTDRAEAQTLQSSLIGALRVAIAGPGTMSETDKKLLESVIADPTRIFSLDASNKRTLQTLMGSLDDKFAASAKARGLNVKTPAEIKQDKSKEYEAWAKANPNNPKAREYLRLRGQ